MKKFIPFVFFLFILIVYMSCIRSHQTKMKEEDSSRISRPPHEEPEITRAKVSPNHCRILGTIVAIDEQLVSGNSDDPCSKIPCRAIMRIDSILGYGQGFSKPLARGQEIPVLFKYTLQPTKELFPDLKKVYTPVTVGMAIRTDIQAVPTPRFGRAFSPEYIIYDYEVK